jgi:hypothetical protein
MRIGGLMTVLAPGIGQVAAVLAGFFALAWFPPRQGPLLLVPLGQEGRAALVPTAIAGGATLLARGPLPYSLIVEGDRHRLSTAFAHIPMVMLAAPSRWCAGGAA